MDIQTALVLTIQLVALLSIAGALLLYLVCKIRSEPGGTSPNFGDIGGGRAVVVTSCDTALGLQVALHLSTRGFRVFAGIRDMHEDCVAIRAARAWVKECESIPYRGQGMLVALPLDVNREDLLHEAADLIRAHLPAGEDGVWAVINTAGITCRGKLDLQDISHWETMLKTNVIGVLRTSRAFQSLLRNTKGRFITIGACTELPEQDTRGLVAYTATRYAVQGASDVLRQELAPIGIKVVTLTPKNISPDVIYAPPRLATNSSVILPISETAVQIQPKVLTAGALNNIDLALTCAEPELSYSLCHKKQWFTQFMTS